MTHTLFGIPVIENPHVREDQAYLIPTPLRPNTSQLVVGTRRLTDVELAGRWARWYIRKGYADAGLLPDGITVGTEPTPDTVSFIAQLRDISTTT